MTNKFCYLLTLAAFTSLAAMKPYSVSASQTTTVSTMGYRTIQSVETVSVQSPVGCAPRLPWQVWVKYTDGYGEYRQVRWQNSSLVREQAEGNAGAFGNLLEGRLCVAAFAKELFGRLQKRRFLGRGVGVGHEVRLEVMEKRVITQTANQRQQLFDCAINLKSGNLQS